MHGTSVRLAWEAFTSSIVHPPAPTHKIYNHIGAHDHTLEIQPGYYNDINI